MCGEKMMKAGSNCAMLGSPPRMRGKGCRDKVKHCFHGITPAYAGKSLTIPKLTTRSWDHPRVCGEKAAQPFHGVSLIGSPPRMRGKGIQQGDCWVTVGITPAYAGKSETDSGTAPGPKDHPRVCGEKTTLNF